MLRNQADLVPKQKCWHSEILGETQSQVNTQGERGDIEQDQIRHFFPEVWPVKAAVPQTRPTASSVLMDLLD